MNDPIKSINDNISDDPLLFGERVFSWGLIPEVDEVDDEGCKIPHSYTQGCYACDGNPYACCCGDYQDFLDDDQDEDFTDEDGYLKIVRL